MGLPGWGWLSTMLGVVSIELIFFTFGVTKSWDKTFKCFDFTSIMTRLAIFFAKSVIYLVITAPTAEATQAIMGAVVLSCMGVCFMACAVLCFISYKSVHGERPHVVNWTWMLLMSFLVGAGIIFYLIKERQQASDGLLALMMFFIITVQLYQAGTPLLRHCWYSSEVIRDEAAVLAIKTLSITITIATSLYSACSTWISLKPHVTRLSLNVHLAMCLAGTIAGLLQLAMRMINAQKKLKAAYEMIIGAARTWTDKPLQFVNFFSDGGIKGMKYCMTSTCSCFNSTTLWVKALFGGRDPELPLVGEKPHIGARKRNFAERMICLEKCEIF